MGYNISLAASHTGRAFGCCDDWVPLLYVLTCTLYSVGAAHVATGEKRVVLSWVVARTWDDCARLDRVNTVKRHVNVCSVML